MKKKLSLLLASMLVMTLVPVSSFAGTATPESGYTIEAGDDVNDKVEVAYVFGATEEMVQADDVIKFAVSNKLKIAGVELVVNRKTVATSDSASLTINAAAAAEMNAADANVVFIFDLNPDEATEGEFTISAKNTRGTGATAEEFEMFSNKVIGKVVEKASTSLTVTALEDAKTISKDGGTAAKFEIKNLDSNTVTITVDNNLSIANATFTKNGFAVNATRGTGTNVNEWTFDSTMDKVTVELTLTGATNKVSLGEVTATVKVGTPEKDVTIAEVVDYSVSMTAVEKDKKVIPTILAGETATVVATIKAVDGTFSANRLVNFVLDGAKFTTVTDITVTGDATAGDVNVEDKEFDVKLKDGAKEFKIEMKLTASAKANDGVATLTASGRDLGEDITIDVLNVEKAFEIETTVTDIVRGESLETSDITITESEVGQLKVGDIVKIDLPTRLTFNEEPTVEGTNGLKFGDVEYVKVGNDTDETQIMFKVTAKSKGEVGTITISDIAIDMATTGINGRTYAAELLVGDTSYGEFDIVKCVAEYDRVTAATLVFTLGSANYTMNGVVSTLEAPVFTKDGRTMLPIGPLALGLGLDVNYNADTQTATFRDGATGQVVSVKENADVLYNNGIEYKMHTAAVTVNGRIFVPVASITDAFGVSIVWDEATQTVKVN